ncbi:acyl-CoA thioesterase II [Nocardioides mangrovicus]|uniref:Acyl-CoA thioesterase 2 n=1 Tax=Nocardioides mangrovicus TaxID=2478913 RepID=A0A3L8P1L4_9ACTN|nr:acyl-CoA thioesterase II [Nocardioides mangrovicus]RLV49256.1 acyl-CoA thioesterase II [Nocardioides mangrovicus]
MPHSVEELVGLLDLERIDDNLFRGTQPDTSRQRVFGGQVAAQSLVAASRTVDAEHHVHSLHSYFLRPGDPAVPIVYDVDDLRDGRSFTTRRVAARQHGQEIYFQTVSYQIDEDGLDHQDAMPDVTPPQECPQLSDLFRDHAPEAAEEWDKEWAALDIRWAGDSSESGGLAPDQHPARNRLWVRINGELPDDPTLHDAVFTYASDLTLLAVSLVPHRIMIGSPKLMPASLDHAMWFHRRFRADRWWLYDQVSPSASGARGFAVARVFTESGVLGASVAQEGLIRVRTR